MPPLPIISVTRPVSQAIEHAKAVLFQPFDLGRWFVIGFCAWLAYLGQRGFNAHFNIPGHRGGGAGGGFEEARDFVVRNLNWLVPVVIAAVVLLLAVWVFILWLSSRGQFMFLHCVAKNRAEVRVPWNEYASEGNSLFWFRLVVGLIGLVPILLLLIPIILIFVRVIRDNAFTAGALLLLIGLTLLFMLVALVFWVVMKLTTDFVVPIMYLRRGSCLQAWRVLGTLLTGNLGNLVLYLLFQIVLGLAIFVLVITAVVFTCCIAGCLLAIPYLGTVLLLPVLVFQRSYSLYYLAQFGPEYNAFPA